TYLVALPACARGLAMADFVSGCLAVSLFRAPAMAAVLVRVLFFALLVRAEDAGLRRSETLVVRFFAGISIRFRKFRCR
ncbi:MAG TPA: hypothetical protein VNT02_15525, partial [Burkholderiales bacterium]|nr:hypothetical protein [Burkholderiales bacterium]